MASNALRIPFVAGMVLALAGCKSAPTTPDSNSATARIAAQNQLFEEQYQSDLKFSPLTATAYGDFRYNDQLDDVSLAATQRQHAADDGFLTRLKAISTDGFPEQDLLSH